MSISRIFLTGGSGFVGRLLLRELSRTGYEVVALDRSGALTASPDQRLRVVRGNLLEPRTYERELAECDVAVHLAAATGKATRDRHFRDTAEASEALLKACRDASVPRFLLVSSIAASFPDTRDYPYAQAKQRAERAVEASGLDYMIVRPTMILGEGSPLARSLATLALPPVILLPGAGRVRVQPIAVGDVVRALLMVIASERFQGETFEIGGPEILPMEELLQRIRVARTGKRGRVLRVPVGLIQAPLRAAEGLGLASVLPVTAGQFSSFRHDGIVSPNPLQEELSPASVADLLGEEPPRPASDDAAIDRECRVFTRHLIGADPDRLVVASYRKAVATVPALTARNPWDRTLLAMARSSVTGARCADAHAALFARSSTLRKRLVLLLGILEVVPPHSTEIDRALGGSAMSAIGLVALRGVGSMLGLVAGSIVLLPIRLALAARGGRPS